MAPHFRLVMHAPQRHAHEWPLQCPRDTLAERSLAHPRWSDKAQDRRAPLRLQFLNCQEFDNALLDALEPEMIVFENLACSIEVDGRILRELPGQLRHPFKVSVQHRIFTGSLRHAL